MSMNPNSMTDPKQISQFLTNLKKQMAQVDGEIAMMKADSMASLFNNFANMLNQVWGQKEDLDHKLKETQATLEQIYQGHPDIKIAMEKKDAPKKSK